MFVLALTALFSTAALFAMATIAGTVRRHGHAALALRGELERCPEMRVFSYRIVGRGTPFQPAARVIALPVRPKVVRAPRPIAALRAAA